MLLNAHQNIQRKSVDAMETVFELVSNGELQFFSNTRTNFPMLSHVTEQFL